MSQHDWHQHAQRDRAFHDSIGHEYDQVVLAPREIASRALFAPLLQHLPQGGHMLDLGCGTGQGMLRFGPGRASCHGVDHSEGMLAAARSNTAGAGLREVTLERADVRDWLHANTRRFDLISVIGFLHHCSPEVLAEIAEGLARALAPGGRLVVAEPVEVDLSSEPEAIREWNRGVVAELARHSTDVEDPDEAPLPLPLLERSLTEAGLTRLGANRGWEIFSPPRALSADEVARIEALASIPIDNGVVYAAVWAAA